MEPHDLKGGEGFHTQQMPESGVPERERERETERKKVKAGQRPRLH